MQIEMDSNAAFAVMCICGALVIILTTVAVQYRYIHQPIQPMPDPIAQRISAIPFECNRDKLIQLIVTTGGTNPPITAEQP